jgi:hypothetical protein
MSASVCQPPAGRDVEHGLHAVKEAAAVLRTGGILQSSGARSASPVKLFCTKTMWRA